MSKMLSSPWMPLVVAFALAVVALLVILAFAIARSPEERKITSTNAVLTDAIVRVAATSIPAAALVFLGQYVVVSAQERYKIAERHQALADDIADRIRDLAGDLEYSTPSIHARGFEPPDWEDQRRNNYGYMKFMLGQEIARAKRFGESSQRPAAFLLACERYADWVENIDAYSTTGEYNDLSSDEMYNKAKSDVLNWLVDPNYSAEPVVTHYHWLAGEEHTED